MSTNILTWKLNILKAFSFSEEEDRYRHITGIIIVLG